jgi:hypothetical protein
MRESRMSGFVRGARSNTRPYRDPYLFPVAVSLPLSPYLFPCRRISSLSPYLFQTVPLISPRRLRTLSFAMLMPDAFFSTAAHRDFPERQLPCSWPPSPNQIETAPGLLEATAGGKWFVSPPV